MSGDAMRPYIPYNELEDSQRALADSDDAHIRYIAASRRYGIDKLAYDPDSLVRLAVAASIDKLPDGIADALRRDTDRHVRAVAAAGHPDADRNETSAVMEKARRRGIRNEVACAETGEVFESAAEAARRLGVSENSLYKAISTGTTIKGMTLTYTGKTTSSAVARAVVCLETGELYQSVTEAASAQSKTVMGFIKSLKRGWRCNGLHFAYSDDPDLEEKLSRYADGSRALMDPHHDAEDRDIDR